MKRNKERTVQAVIADTNKLINEINECKDQETLSSLINDAKKIKNDKPSLPAGKTTTINFRDVAKLDEKIDRAINEAKQRIKPVVNASTSATVEDVENVENVENVEDVEDVEDEQPSVQIDESEQIKKLRTLLENLNAKRQQHESNKKTKSAADAAQNIYDKMTVLLDAYVQNPTSNKESFKKGASDLLNFKNCDVQELHKHRDYKGILVNIIACLTLIGMIVSKYRDNGFFSPVRTDSGEVIDKLRDAVDEVSKSSLS